MWILDFLKGLYAAYAAGKAARAAADLPKGQEAVDQIKADGDTIRAQLGTTRTGAGN